MTKFKVGDGAPMTSGRIMVNSLHHAVVGGAKVAGVIGLMAGAYACGLGTNRSELQNLRQENRLLNELGRQPLQQPPQFQPMSSSSGTTNFFINVFGNSSALVYFDNATNSIRIEGGGNSVKSVQQAAQQPSEDQMQ